MDYRKELGVLDEIVNAFSNKDEVEIQNACKYYMESDLISQLLNDFGAFSRMCADRSEVCKYWDGLLDIMKVIQRLVSADREGNWDDHLNAVH